MAVERFETGENVSVEIADQLKHTLEAGGVEFVDGSGDEPGVRLRNVRL